MYIFFSLLLMIFWLNPKIQKWMFTQPKHKQIENHIANYRNRPSTNPGGEVNEALKVISTLPRSQISIWIPAPLYTNTPWLTKWLIKNLIEIPTEIRKKQGKKKTSDPNSKQRFFETRKPAKESTVFIFLSRKNKIEPVLFKNQAQLHFFFFFPLADSSNVFVYISRIGD